MCVRNTRQRTTVTEGTIPDNPDPAPGPSRHHPRSRRTAPPRTAHLCHFIFLLSVAPDCKNDLPRLGTHLPKRSIARRAPNRGLRNLPCPIGPLGIRMSPSARHLQDNAAYCGVGPYSGPLRPRFHVRAPSHSLALTSTFIHVRLVRCTRRQCACRPRMALPVQRSSAAGVARHYDVRAILFPGPLVPHGHRWAGETRWPRAAKWAEGVGAASLEVQRYFLMPAQRSGGLLDRFCAHYIILRLVMRENT